MKWLVAACAALLLLLAIIVRRLDDEELADAPQTIATEVDARANLVVDRQSLKQAEVASEALNSTVAAVVNKPEVPTASTLPFTAVANSRSGCVPKAVDTFDTPLMPNVPARSSAPAMASTLNKDACYAAAREILRARWMFDTTATQTVSYTPMGPPWNRYGGSVHKIVLQEMCAGDRTSEARPAATIELFFATAHETIRVLIGPYWISDGTIQSPLTEEQYSHITKTLSGRRRDAIGPTGNMSPEIFDKRLKERYFNRITAEEEAQKQRDEELRRTQQGLPAECFE